MAGTQSILCVGYYHCWYWLDIEWCKTHPGPKQSKREKAGSILSSISHSLMPSYSFAHLNPRNHGSMGHFAKTGSGGFDGFAQIQNPAGQPQCLQTVSSQWDVTGVRVGMGCSRPPGFSFQTSHGGQFYLDQSRGDLFPTSLEMK